MSRCSPSSSRSPSPLATGRPHLEVPFPHPGPPTAHPTQPSLLSLEPENPAPTPPGPSSEGGSADPEAEGAAPAEGEPEGEAVLMEEDLIQQSLDDYDAGKYSPRLLTAHELPLDAHVLEPDEDLQRLQLSRQQLQVTGACCSPPAQMGCGAGPASGSLWTCSVPLPPCLSIHLSLAHWFIHTGTMTS